MKKYSEFIAENEDDEHGHLFHTSYQDKPINGKTASFHKPVTWFFSQKHDNEHPHSAARESGAILKREREDGQKSATNIYRPKHKLNLASEDQVQHAAKEIGHPYHDGPAYELLDHNVNGDKRNTNKLIHHLRSKGFHGAEHGDYSQVNHQHDHTSVALFRPHDHLNHVDHHTDHNSLIAKYGKDHEQKKARDGEY